MNWKVWDELWWVSYIVLAVWIVNGFLVFFLLTQIDSIVNVQLYSFGLEFSKQWADPYWTSTRLMMVFLGVPMALSAAVFVAGLRKFRKKAKTVFAKQKAKPPETALEETTEVATEKQPETVPATEEEMEIIPEKETRDASEEKQASLPEVECEPEPAETTEGVIEPQLEVIQRQEIQPPVENPEAKKDTIRDETLGDVETGTEISCPQCGKIFNRPMVKLDFNKGTTRLVSVCPFCSHVLGEASGSENAEKTQE
jgi:hypothetical protein